MTYLFANNARSTLAAGINDSATALSVQAGDGALFPSPTGVEEFRCIIYNAAGDWELITVTTRATDAFSVIVRGQEGTSPLAWSADDYISCRETKESLEYMLQHSDVDDTPVDAATDVPISSNWAFDMDAKARTSGRQMYSVVPSMMTAKASGGATAGVLEVGSDETYDIFTFNTTTSAYIYFAFLLPPSWDNATSFSAKLFWSHAATTTNFDVKWGLGGAGINNSGSLNITYGTGDTLVDTGGTTDYMYITAEMTIVAMGGTPVAGNYAYFRLYRHATDGTDTLDADVRLHGIQLYYSVTEGNEA